MWQAALAPSADGSDPTLAAILAAEPEHEPGTAWAYNQVATYLAAAAVRAVAGVGVLDLLRPRLLTALDPLGAPDVRWHRTATGRELGFSGIHVGTDAVLALAQLHLDRGSWSGARLLSPDWVATATTPTGLPNREPDAGPDWRQGYGCSFWTARHGYRGDGAYGQFAIVLPEHDVALAITGETRDMQAVLDLVWEHLLRAFADGGDADADAELEARLGGSGRPRPRPRPASGPSSGSWTRAEDSQLPATYAALRVAPGAATAYELALQCHGTQATIRVGDGTWARVDAGRRWHRAARRGLGRLGR